MLERLEVPEVKVTEYSQKTGLPEEYLREHLGISEYVNEYGSSVLEIPYYTEEGQVFRKRLRNGSQRFWSKGEGLIPYGLNWLNGASRVILAEGEGDTSNLLYCGYQVLGIPGACTFKDDWVTYVKEYPEIYLAGDNDEAGERFNKDIAKKLYESGYQGQVKEVCLPVSVKDVNDMYIKSGDSFKALFDGLVEHAKIITESQHMNIIPSSHPLRGSDGRKNNLLPIVDLSEMDEPEPMKFIVEDILPDNYLSVIFGAGASGKSYLALTIVCCVAMGIDFLGKSVIKGNVLYLDFELEQYEQTRRAYRVARGLGLERPPKGLFYLQPGSNQDVPLKLQDLITRLRNTIETNKVRLVVVDSAGMAIEGDTEKAKDVISLFQALRGLKVSILLIDHQSKLKQGEDYKNKSVFGSIYKFNLARSIFQLEVVENQQGIAKTVLRHTKSNFTTMFEPMGLTKHFVNDFSVSQCNEALDIAAQTKAEDEKWEEIKKAFIDRGGTATAKELCETSGVAIGTVRNKMIERRKTEDIFVTGEKMGKAIIYELNTSFSSSSLPNPYKEDEERPSKSEAVDLLKQEFGAEVIEEREVPKD